MGEIALADGGLGRVRRHRISGTAAVNQECTDGDGESESKQRTVAKKGQGAEALAGTEAATVDFKAKEVRTHHNAEENSEKGRGQKSCIAQRDTAEEPQTDEKLEGRKEMRGRADERRWKQLVGVDLHSEHGERNPHRTHRPGNRSLRLEFGVGGNKKDTRERKAAEKEEDFANRSRIRHFQSNPNCYWAISESRYCFMMGQVKMPDMGG